LRSSSKLTLPGSLHMGMVHHEGQGQVMGRPRDHGHAVRCKLTRPSFQILTNEPQSSVAAIPRWCWRGYIQSGGMFVGRWRDGMSKEHMRGTSRQLAHTAPNALPKATKDPGPCSAQAIRSTQPTIQRASPNPKASPAHFSIPTVPHRPYSTSLADSLNSSNTPQRRALIRLSAHGLWPLWLPA
jgi:hypothetical protein